MPLYFGPSPPSPSPPLVTDEIHVLSCSNGLVLCSNTSASPAQYYVCNAVTKKWVTIPQSPHGASQARVGFLCRAPILSSNNLIENTSISEDFDISCSFRMVRILLDSDDRDELSHRDNAIPCNGSLYWRISEVLLVIDPYSGKHGTVKLSDKIIGCRYDRKDIYIGESNGRLRCIMFQSGTFTIYELENNDTYAGNWLSVQMIHYSCIKYEKYSWIGRFFEGRSSPRSRQGISSIVFHPFDEIVVFICIPGDITLFDMGTKKLTTIWDVGNEYERDSHVPKAFPIVLPW